jgi:GTPase involved in cell partitioning and DNA repair
MSAPTTRTPQGREFLRHLRRTRMVLHVVDVVEADPLADYLTVRDELRMYNPDFVLRPHVVALNKADVLGDGGTEWIEGVRQGILAAYDVQQVRLSSTQPPRHTWTNQVALTRAHQRTGVRVRWLSNIFSSLPTALLCTCASSLTC